MLSFKKRPCALCECAIGASLKDHVRSESSCEIIVIRLSFVCLNPVLPPGSCALPIMPYIPALQSHLLRPSWPHLGPCIFQQKRNETTHGRIRLAQLSARRPPVQYQQCKQAHKHGRGVMHSPRTAHHHWCRSSSSISSPEKLLCITSILLSSSVVICYDDYCYYDIAFLIKYAYSGPSGNSANKGGLGVQGFGGGAACRGGRGTVLGFRV